MIELNRFIYLKDTGCFIIAEQINDYILYHRHRVIIPLKILCSGSIPTNVDKKFTYAYWSTT